MWHPSLANDPDGLVLEAVHTLIALLGLHHVALKLLDLEVLGVTRVSLEAQLHHHRLPLPELLIGLGLGVEQLIGHTTGLVPQHGLALEVQLVEHLHVIDNLVVEGLDILHEVHLCLLLNSECLGS